MRTIPVRAYASRGHVITTVQSNVSHWAMGSRQLLREGLSIASILGILQFKSENRVDHDVLNLSSAVCRPGAPNPSDMVSKLQRLITNSCQNGETGSQHKSRYRHHWAFKRGFATKIRKLGHEIISS